MEDFIKRNTKSLLSFAVEGFKYNLQVLPDVITASAILFAMLFQSPPMAALGAALFAVTFLHRGFASLLSSIIPDLIAAPQDANKCSGRFPGVSYQTLLGFANSGSLGSPVDSAWPSYYSTYIGFLAGWIGTLPAIYANELAASPKRASSVYFGIVNLAILCVAVMIYRISSECESFMSTSIGLVGGFFIGLGVVLLASWLTDRRATNILGMPLLRSKAADGKPIYVCERSAAAEENENDFS